MKPTSREEFKQYCLRSLGHPVIKIDVTDEQIDDRIDEALNYFTDYHYLGTFRSFYKFQVTEQMKSDGYITLPENIIGAVKLFPLGTGINSGNMFNVTYQFALNDLHALTSVSLVPYYMSMQQLALIEQILVPETQIRFNRLRNRLYIDMEFSRIVTGQYMILDAYECIVPEEWTKVWSDRWLADYATALIKRQWGNNLSKFKGVALPGGITLNANEIRMEANEEIADLKERMQTDIAPYASHFIG